MSTKLDKYTRQMTEGSIIKSLLVIAWPIVLANTLHTAYQLIDTFWVGRLGTAAVAAVSVTFPLIFLLLSIGFGLGIAGSVFVGQYAGARQHDQVDHISAQVVIMTLIAAFILSTIGYLSSPWILRLIGVSDDVYYDANNYLQISCIGLVFTFGFIIFQSLLRGVGEVRFPLMIVFITVIMNAILDPWFIFGWGPVEGHGVTGAAWATICTHAVGFLVGLFVLFRGNFGIKLKVQELVPDITLLKRIIMVGLPASVEQATRVLGSIMLTFLATGFGTLALATYGIGTRMLGFIFIPAFGLAMATSTLVAQNIGTGNLDRAEQAARLSGWTAFWGLNAVAVLFFIFAESLIRFFVPNEEALIQSGTEFVYIVCLSFGVIGAQQALFGAFRGAGGTISPMVIAMITQWVLQFPLSYIMCMHTSLGVTGIWWGFPVANFITMIITILWYKRGQWIQVKITEREVIVPIPENEVLIEEAVKEQEYIN